MKARQVATQGLGVSGQEEPGEGQPAIPEQVQRGEQVLVGQTQQVIGGALPTRRIAQLLRGRGREQVRRAAFDLPGGEIGLSGLDQDAAAQAARHGLAVFADAHLGSPLAVGIGRQAAVDHADGHFDHLVHRLLAAAFGPLFEIEVLILHGVGGPRVQFSQQGLDVA